MQKWAEGLYKSSQWQKVREYVLKRDSFLCQECLKNGIYSTAEEVHHIKPVTRQNINDVNITLNTDNLVSLCKNCHAARHSKKRWKVDKMGRITAIR